MELIRISESKLKIMLEPEDLRRYELDPAVTDLDYSSPETREIFRTILDDVREQTGFNTRDGRIFLQFYPSKAGGCELFVTRLTPSDPQGEKPPDGAETAQSGRVPIAYRAALSSPGAGRPQAPLPALRGTPHLQPRRRLTYGFADPEDLFAACRRLAALPFDGESAVYTTPDRKTWYLILQAPVSPLLPDPLAFLSEYGTRFPSARLSLRLSEHTTPICTDRAVEMLAGY